MLRRPRGRRPRVVRRPAAKRATCERDRARDDPHRELGRARRAVRAPRGRVLLAAQGQPRRDGRPGRTELRHRAYGDPRVRPPRGLEPAALEPRRAERHAALVEGARDGRLVAIRSVRDRYQVGWNRSIAEVFAEDYAYTHFGRGFRISWLEPPSRVVQQAIRADLGLLSPGSATHTRRSGPSSSSGGAPSLRRPRCRRLRPARAEPPRPARRRASATPGGVDGSRSRARAPPSAAAS